jgi:glycosyltransferase involved in cell wall biosynthesis
VDEDSEVALIIQRADCGVVVGPEDPLALAQVVLKLYHDPRILSEMGKNGRAYVEKTNIRSICTRKYLELINQVAY